MTMIARIPADKTHELGLYVWVSEHWDHHLAGLCRLRGELCRFERVYGSRWVTIHRLTAAEKARWLWRKKLFEVCVGRHWTYSGKVLARGFRWRKPKWLHRILFAGFYGLPLRKCPS